MAEEPLADDELIPTIWSPNFQIVGIVAIIGTRPTILIALARIVG